jgi:hypothetical protein
MTFAKVAKMLMESEEAKYKRGQQPYRAWQ